jgi:hypothetical protein
MWAPSLVGSLSPDTIVPSSAVPANLVRQLSELAAEPVDLVGVVRVEHDARAGERGLGAAEQFSRSSAVPFDEGNRGLVEGGHRDVIGVVAIAQVDALRKVASSDVEIASMQLEMTEVVELDADHPPIAQAPIQGQAFTVELGRRVEVPGETGTRGEHVERGNAGGRWKALRVLPSLGG